MTDITPIIRIVIELIGALIGVFIIPWLRAKYGTEKLNQMISTVEIGVRAAEQIGKNLGYTGEQKKQYVTDWLKSQGITVTESVDNLIEAMVYELKDELTSDVE